MSIQSVKYSDRKINPHRSDNEIQQESGSIKQLRDCLPYLVKMTDYQLKKINIHPDGEFHDCSNGKQALDMVNHIKRVFRSQGFGCYALHNYIWIVPFVHQSLHMPDFERAKKVLPDLKGELLGTTFPDEKPVKDSHKPFQNPWDFKSIMVLLVVVWIVVDILF